MKAIIEADPLTTTEEVTEELNRDHSMVMGYLKEIGKVKKLHKRVPHELIANQNNCCFEVSLLLFYATTMNDFLIGV